MTKKRIILAIIAVAVVAVAAFILMPKSGASGPQNWATTAVSSQNIAQSITATGTIEPVNYVDVGTQVSGILTTIYVDYNSVVKKGEVIAELDKSTLQLTVDNDKTNVAEAKSEYEYQLANYTRVKTLHEKSLVSDSDYEIALYNYNKSVTGYETAETNLKKSEINLGYATIYSPIDGVVLYRAVEEGQTVASSYSTPTLFTVAADLTDMRVIADIDEADIGNVKEGQNVTFTVDAFPSEEFYGQVTQVRQQATVESNVVTYEVVISAANPDLKLKPGLTASVEVFVIDEFCPTVVPASALIFDPSIYGYSTGATASAAPAQQAQGGQRPEGGQGGQRPEGGQGGQRPEGGPSASQNRATTTSGSSTGTVWVKNGNDISAVTVKVGLSNGVLTAVEGVSLNDQVVTGVELVSTVKSEAPTTTENPFVQTPQQGRGGGPGGR